MSKPTRRGSPPRGAAPNPRALLEPGFAALRDGRAARAADLAGRVLARAPDHHGALNLAGLAALQQGDTATAVARLERAATLAPGEPIYQANLGAALRAAHRHGEAAAACRRALALKPGYRAALVTLGAALFASEDYAGALAAYDQALATPPAEALLHAYRGDALRELGRVRAAVAAYEQALALAPDLAHALGNLGLTLLGLGEHERALELCERACALSPTVGQQAARAWMSLGTARRLEGLLEPAMAAYAQAHELDPDSAQLKTLIGGVWAEVGDLPQALAWYGQALALEPERIETRCALAEATLEAGEVPTAIEQFRALLADHPEHPTGHLGLGAALWEDGDAAGAIAACREAVALRPEDAGARARLAGILASAGDVTAANAMNREALEVNPQCVPALSNLAQNLRGQLPVADAERMEQLLGARWARDGAQATLHFGLAHYYDGLKDYGRAAEHALAANARHWTYKAERGWHYDPVEYAAHCDALMAAFTPEFFAQTRGHGDLSEVPVFIVGMPRSGTTLTEQILASHARVHGVGERNFAARAFAALPRALGRPAATGPVACLPDLTPEVTRRLAAAHLGALHGLARKAGRADAEVLHIVDKMPDNYSLLGWIITAFPRARIIHCRRDVRDVALSCWMTQFKEIRWAFDLGHLAERIIAYQRLMAHWRAVLPVPMLEIDYEETVADQVGQTRRLLDFLGLPWDPACLEFHQGERLVRTASVTQVREPVYRRSVERWRRYEAMLAPLLGRVAAD
ncbi:tetratricopeptide repeat-containing sulfotransferase family protein [Candidatus Thiodictyon syntrophicum]|jgi:tetratricopeptide (TPR) repeat protein|uniref:Sulfotransferase n=1 Tax=Candidatus Thiodictyon syntrophicum TaxID=1166950 RepID=A0A2K8UA24_9GAMM|nr:tetratricopeptide repeat-containing sulfotransferase family protein [Candidatus Thiodictyon syntrophicum]AUB82438.1 sulfotransferase [Candidatus Thiodictyon syntrophicum]